MGLSFFVIPESVNHLGEIFSENLKILCLWRYVFLQCFHPIVKKYLESYNPKTLAVIRFLAHFHLLGSRIQVFITDALKAKQTQLTFWKKKRRLYLCGFIDGIILTEGS